MAAWLETATRALLERDPPEMLAPTDTRAFTLVMIAFRAGEEQRLVQAIQRGCGVSQDEAQRLAGGLLPVILKRGLSFPDAAIGQYELIACDAVSVIIADDVVSRPPPGYLPELYPCLLQSPEFQSVTATIESLPPGQHAREFLEHFLGRAECELPLELELMRKKARVMAILAAKIAGRVVIHDPLRAP